MRVDNRIVVRRGPSRAAPYAWEEWSANAPWALVPLPQGGSAATEAPLLAAAAPCSSVAVAVTLVTGRVPSCKPSVGET
jgi:hypothetical protein